MSFADRVVGRPTLFLVLFGLLGILGIYAAANLAIDLYPEINPPFIFVITNYDGAGPEEVENIVTRPLEGQLGGINGVKKMVSRSYEGSSILELEFDWGKNLDEISNDVRDRLEFVRDVLPAEVSSPQLIKFDPSLAPVMDLQISGDRSADLLRELANEIIAPRFEQIDGVGQAFVTGGRDRIIRVEVPLRRLAALKMNMLRIRDTLRIQNTQRAGGNVRSGDSTLVVRTAGSYSSLDQIRDTVVMTDPTPGGASVLLRDIGDVREGYSDRDRHTYVDGKEGIFISVQKRSGANLVNTAKTIRDQLPSIQAALPPGVSMSILSDSSRIINQSLEHVARAASSGVLLAIIILFLFLRSGISTLTIAISIPLAVIITMMLMFFFGLTLNIMTLTGLALGVGMLVDNSIVILENIYRYRERGAKARIAAVLGSREMGNAVSASTITTICVFAPIALFRSQLEFIGEIFADMAFTVVISLVSSLVVAVLLVPVLAGNQLPPPLDHERLLRRRMPKLDGWLAGGMRRMENGYRNALQFILHHRWSRYAVGGGVLALLVLSIFVATRIGLVFAPDFEDDYVQINIEFPAGTSLERANTVMLALENDVKEEVAAYDSLVVTVGESSFAGFAGSVRADRGSIALTLPPFDERIDSVNDVKRKIRLHVDDIPDAKVSFGQQGGRSLSGGAAIDVTVQSDDYDLALNAAFEIRNALVREATIVTEPEVGVEIGLPELQVTIDREHADAVGLDATTIGANVQAAIDGVVATQYRAGGEELDVYLLSTERGEARISDLERLVLIGQQGLRIPLASVATLERGVGPVQIIRENQRRSVHVTASTLAGVDINDADAEVRRIVAEFVPADPNLQITFGGEFMELGDQTLNLIAIFLLSVVLVFGVMAAQFESFKTPFIIIFTVPLNIIGVVFIHAITGDPLNLFTALGLVVLVGIVVNNGIVLVDYTNLLRRRGMALKDACMEAGRHRLRPVLMTTLTTVLALVPVAFASGEGSSLIQPIAKTLVGGLAASSVLTLFLVPIIYERVHRRSERKSLALSVAK